MTKRLDPIDLDIIGTSPGLINPEQSKNETKCEKIMSNHKWILIFDIERDFVSLQIRIL